METPIILHPPRPPSQSLQSVESVLNSLDAIGTGTIPTTAIKTKTETEIDHSLTCQECKQVFSLQSAMDSMTPASSSSTSSAILNCNHPSLTLPLLRLCTQLQQELASRPVVTSVSFSPLLPLPSSSSASSPTSPSVPSQSSQSISDHPHPHSQPHPDPVIQPVPQTALQLAPQQADNDVGENSNLIAHDSEHQPHKPTFQQVTQQHHEKQIDDENVSHAETENSSFSSLHQSCPSSSSERHLLAVAAPHAPIIISSSTFSCVSTPSPQLLDHDKQVHQQHILEGGKENEVEENGATFLHQPKEQPQQIQQHHTENQTRTQQHVMESQEQEQKLDEHVQKLHPNGVVKVLLQPQKSLNLNAQSQIESSHPLCTDDTCKSPSILPPLPSILSPSPPSFSLPPSPPSCSFSSPPPPILPANGDLSVFSVCELSSSALQLYPELTPILAVDPNADSNLTDTPTTTTKSLDVAPISSQNRGGKHIQAGSDEHLYTAAHVYLFDSFHCRPIFHRSTPLSLYYYAKCHSGRWKFLLHLIGFLHLFLGFIEPPSSLSQGGPFSKPSHLVCGMVELIFLSLYAINTAMQYGNKLNTHATI